VAATTICPEVKHTRASRELLRRTWRLIGTSVK
jgi:hypothetical protein